MNKTPISSGRMSTGITTVDEYIAQFDAEVQVALQHLRQVIQKAAPQAEEVFSYGIPGYKQMGPVVYFGAYPKHLSLYAVNKDMQETFSELQDFKITGSTIHFTLEKILPDELITKIVERRLHENEMRTALKKNNKK